jgi:hypothetical protein
VAIIASFASGDYRGLRLARQAGIGALPNGAQTFCAGGPGWQITTAPHIGARGAVMAPNGEK